MKFLYERVTICILITRKQKNDLYFRLVFHLFSNHRFRMLIQILILVRKLLYYVNFPHFLCLDKLIFMLFDSDIIFFFCDVFGFSRSDFVVTFLCILFALERLVFLFCLIVHSWHLSLSNRLLILYLNFFYYIKFRKYFICLYNIIPTFTILLNQINKPYYFYCVKFKMVWNWPLQIFIKARFIWSCNHAVCCWIIETIL